MLWAIWWAWLALGLILVILEIVIPAFLFLGFAIGAAVVGVLVLVGLTLSLAWSLVVFAVISLVAWLLLRRAFGIRKGQVKTWKTDINED